MMFKEVLERARALLREEEEVLGKPHTSEQVESSTERKVPPLKLKVIRGPEGVEYEIVKPEFILHFKRSILLDSGLAEVTSTECQESSGQQFAENETSSKLHTEHSYTVLTACMSGRAFPDLSCAQNEDGSEDQKIQNLSAEDSLRTQKVHEVIWQRLFSQDGIIGRQTKKVTMH
ncbi:unnamed protein product [Cylicostephanus goldi]|uniref:Uncharacterized protein n=1 Tax=Cylicostephanus goldi TaxID=71465 RepID=A0A3P7PWV2_CYLGO|nr:unnamed protein product [Cylicostephanus goldi]